MFANISLQQRVNELTPVAVGLLYITMGAVGVLLNLTTVAMIVSRRVYRLSAYTIMANVALADALVIIITGCACGATILFSTDISMFSTIVTNEDLIMNNASRIAPSKHHMTANNEQWEENKGGYTANSTVIKHHSIHSLNNMHSYLRKQEQEQMQEMHNEANFRKRQKRFWQISKNFAEKRKKKNEKVKFEDKKLLYNKQQQQQQKQQQQSWGFKASRGFGPLEKPATNTRTKRAASMHELDNQNSRFIESLICFIKIASWTAGVVSYAFLGLNRCVAICFYGSKARAFNRVSVAIISSSFTWIVGICAAAIGTFPTPLVRTRLKLWTISFEISGGSRPVIFVGASLCIYAISVTLQWICSTLVLLKICQVKKKISKNKLNQNSANRFKKQARLTFQFFYPSLFCTISSILYFAKPFSQNYFSSAHFIFLHIIWLGNHMCNPFIYGYFNERMRLSYYEILTCARLRLAIAKRRNRNLCNISRRSAHHQRVAQQMSVRSVASNKSNGNFVRNSLQIQSRDFEQLCEFMMRVNPLYDSSEGWRESSTDDEDSSVEMNNKNDVHTMNVTAKNSGMVLPQSTTFSTNSRITYRNGGSGGLGALELRARDEASNAYAIAALKLQQQHRSSRSIVLDLGRQTVEHWAAFAKKVSI